MEARNAGLLSAVALAATACLARSDPPTPVAATADPLATAARVASVATSAPDLDAGLTVRRWEAGRRAGDPGAVVAAAVVVVAEELAAAQWATVEGIDWPGPGAAVVTFLLVGPDSAAQGPRHGGASVTRTAVAVLVDGDGAQATGDHWELPQPNQTIGSLLLEPAVDDPMRVSAAMALAAAGLMPADLVGLSQATDRWPVVAHLRGPDGRDRAVWLRWAGDVLVVAGSTNRPGATP